MAKVYGPRQPHQPSVVTDPCQPTRSGQMAYKSSFDGRMEKRLPIAIVVRLTHAQDQPVNGAEQTYTDNVSARGARVVSHRPWAAGDVVTVTSLKDEIAIRAKVVYCYQVMEGRYYLGLNFQDHGVTWSAYANYAKS